MMAARPWAQALISVGAFSGRHRCRPRTRGVRIGLAELITARGAGVQVWVAQVGGA